MTVEQITDYLSEHITDPVPKFILIKEIFKTAPSSLEYVSAYNDIKQSEWYRDLANEQQENGAWGPFHGGFVTQMKGKKFSCTEAALRRARELSLSKDDPVVARCIRYMERLLRGEEQSPDRVEIHRDGGKNAYLCGFYGLSANINMFDPENPEIAPYKRNAIDNIRLAFACGGFDEDIWGQALREYRVPTLVSPGCAFSLMLMREEGYMEDTLQRLYLAYHWDRKAAVIKANHVSTYEHIPAAISYMSKFPPADKKRLEDKDFTIWLSLLELLSGFSLFGEFIKDDTFEYLLNEADRMVLGEVILPDPPGGHANTCNHAVNGRYAESWRVKHKRKTDMVLRIARILAKCS